MRVSNIRILTFLSLVSIFSLFISQNVLAQTTPVTLPVPVIDWRLNGSVNGGLKLVNSSGGQYGLTNYGATSGPGKSGDVDGALVLNGTSQYVSFSPYNLGASDFTIAARVKASNLSGTRPIFMQEQSGPASCPHLKLFLEGGVPRLYVCDNQYAQFVFGKTTLQPNVWYDIVATRKNGLYKLYINGVLDSSSNYTAGNKFIPNITSTSYLGYQYNSTYPGAKAYWAGSIDAVKVYNSEIPTTNLSQIFATTTPTPTTITTPATSTTTTTTPVKTNTAPILTLVGSSTISIIQGTPYTDAGATAFDAEDGNLTSKVVMIQGVSNPGPGSYWISYTVTDSKGLMIRVNRTLNVTPKPAAPVVPVNTAPTISLLGSSSVGLSQGQTFTDQGATATDAEDGNISSKIVKTSNINSSVPGTYTVTYKVSDVGGLNALVTRTVTVTASLPPKINLLGSSTVSISQGTNFVEPGFTAVDPEIGSITASVLVTGSVNTSIVGNYVLTYKVSDPWGQTASATRNINVIPKPNTSPIIKLNGLGAISLTQGDSYVEQGATATDVEDGNLTSKIVTAGTINMANVGTTTLTYKVTDSGNLSAEVTRAVVINPKDPCKLTGPTPTDGSIYTDLPTGVAIPLYGSYVKYCDRLYSYGNGQQRTKLNYVGPYEEKKWLYNLRDSDITFLDPKPITITYKNPVGFESFTIPYQQNLTFRLPVDGQFYLSAGDVMRQQIYFRDGYSLKTFDFNKFGSDYLDSELAKKGMKMSDQICFNDPLKDQKMKVVNDLGIPTAFINYGCGYYMLGVNGGSSWIAQTGKKAFYKETNSDPDALIGDSPSYYTGDIGSAAGGLGWTNSTLSISEIKVILKGDQPRLPPQSYVQTIAPNNPHAAIVTGSLQGQIGPTPPSIEQALRNAALANGISVTDAELKAYAEISNAAGVLAAGIANGTAQNPLFSTSTKVNTALVAPTGFPSTSSWATKPGPEITGSTNFVEWTKDDKATSYQIVLINITNATTTILAEVTNVNNYAFKNLFEGNKYAFVVKSCNAYDCGFTSAIRYFQTKAPAPVVVPPPTTTSTTSPTTTPAPVTTITSTTTNSQIIPKVETGLIGEVNVFIRDINGNPKSNVSIIAADSITAPAILSTTFPKPPIITKTDSQGKFTLKASDFSTPISGTKIYVKLYVNQLQTGSYITISFDSKDINRNIYLDGILEMQLNGTSIILSLMPGIGEGYDLFTLITGFDPVTGEVLSNFQKTITFIGFAGGISSGKVARETVEMALKKLETELGVSLSIILGAADEVALTEYKISNWQDLVALKDKLSIDVFVNKVKVLIIKKTRLSEISDAMKSQFLSDDLERLIMDDQYFQKMKTEIPSKVRGDIYADSIASLFTKIDDKLYSTLAQKFGVDIATLKTMSVTRETSLDLASGFNTRADIMLLKETGPNTFIGYHIEIKNSVDSPFTVSQLDYYLNIYNKVFEYTTKSLLPTKSGTTVGTSKITIKGSAYIEGNGRDLTTYTVNVPK